MLNNSYQVQQFGQNMHHHMLAYLWRRGDTFITFLWEMLSEVGGWEVSECFGRPIIIFFIKENWICAMTRHMLITYYWKEIFLLTLTSDSEGIL